MHYFTTVTHFFLSYRSVIGSSCVILEEFALKKTESPRSLELITTNNLRLSYHYIFESEDDHRIIRSDYLFNSCNPCSKLN